MNRFYNELMCHSRLHILQHDKNVERYHNILVATSINDFVNLPCMCSMYQLKRLIEWRLYVQSQTQCMATLARYFSEKMTDESTLTLDPRLHTLKKIALRAGAPDHIASVAATLCSWFSNTRKIYELVVLPHANGRECAHTFEAFVLEGDACRRRLNKTWTDELKKM